MTIIKRDDTLINRYRIVQIETGKVLGSCETRSEAINLGKSYGGFPHVKMVDTETHI